MGDFILGYFLLLPVLFRIGVATSIVCYPSNKYKTPQNLPELGFRMTKAAINNISSRQT
jgi:hypothetical protein